MLFRVSLKRDPVPILVEDRVHVRAKSQRFDLKGILLPFAATYKIIRRTAYRI
jgi:hypothetical protein